LPGILEFGWGRILTVLKSKRDTLVNNESFLAYNDGSAEHAAEMNPSSPFKLDGEFAMCIVQSLISGFHATSILALSPDGTVLFANQIAVNGFPGFTTESVVGANMLDLAPREWAEERIKIMQLAIEREHPIIVLEILVGTRLSTTFSPIPYIRDGKQQWKILVTVEHVTPMKLDLLRKQKSPEELINASVIDLGALRVLTPRELEVLALMGQGLRQKQIAERLHRSVSTIDRHRERIGVKLGIADRIELVALAREAALEVEDAHRKQVSFGHKRFERKPNDSA
jgi:DNA-binding CsgD family transcriptional regulator